jgi:hypothetical protein
VVEVIKEAFEEYARKLSGLFNEYGDFKCNTTSSEAMLEHANLIEELHEGLEGLGLKVEYVTDDFRVADDYEFYGERYKVVSSNKVYGVKVIIARSRWTGEYRPCNVLIEEW